MVVVEKAQHDVHGEGLGGEGAALEDLPHVGGEADVGAGGDRVRGDGEVVAGAPRHHHVGSRIQGLGDGLPAHLRDDGGGVVEGFPGDGEARLEVLDLSPRQRPLDPLPGDVGVDPGEANAVPLLARHLAHDVDPSSRPAPRVPNRPRCR